MLRHHVVRQLLAQVGAQGTGLAAAGLAWGGFGLGGDLIGHQTLVTGHVLADDGHYLGDAVELAQDRFDLAQLDAVAAYLHLVVEPAQVLQRAVVAPAAAVAGAVDAAAGGGRVGDEAFSGQLRPVQVALGHALATDQDLAGRAERYVHAIGIDDADVGVVDGATDTDVLRLRGYLPAGGPDGGLGGAVHVPQCQRQGGQLAGQVQRQGLAPDQRAKARRRFPVGGQQQAPGARRGLHDADLPLGQAFGQAVTVTGVIPVGHVDGAPGDQRRDQFQQGDVERQRGHGQQPVAGTDARPAGHRQQQVGGGPVGHGHPLGLAGRAGGVDHVGGGLGLRAVEVRFHGAFGRQVVDDLLGRDGQRLFGGPLEGLADLQGVGIGQHERQGGIFGHVGQPVLREVRIQRHVGGTGTPDGPLGHHHGHAPGQAQAHQAARAHALLLQAFGQLVAGVEQRAVAELVPGIGHGQLAQLGGADAVDQRYRGAVQALRASGVVPAGQQRLLGIAQGGLGADGTLRVFGHGEQQRGVALQPLVDAGIVEQRGAVLAFDAQPLVDRGEVEEEFEVLEAARHAGDMRLEAVEAHHGRIQSLVEVEHHRNQRQARRITLQGQVAQQRAEGEALVLEGIEQLALHAGQPVGAGGFRVDAVAHRQQVHAVADDVGQFGRQLAGGGYPHHHVGTAGQARDEQLEAAEQEREQADAQAAGGLLQAGEVVCGNQMVDAAGGHLAAGRARVIGGQVGDGHVLLVLLRPVLHVGTGIGRAGELVLVVGVVGVGRGRQRLAPEGAGQITQHEAERIAVTDQVVGRQQQHAVVIGHAQQVGPKERTFPQIEGFAHHLLAPVGQPAGAGGGILAAQVGHLEDQGGGTDRLHQHFRAVVAEHGPQCLVGREDGTTGLPQAGDGGIIQRPLQAQLDGLVVGEGGFLAHVVGQPHLALRIGGDDHPFDDRGVGGKGVEIHRNTHQAGGQGGGLAGFVAHDVFLGWGRYGGPDGLHGSGGGRRRDTCVSALVPGACRKGRSGGAAPSDHPAAAPGAVQRPDGVRGPCVMRLARRGQ